jgi:hypothetical protein
LHTAQSIDLLTVEESPVGCAPHFERLRNAGRLPRLRFAARYGLFAGISRKRRSILGGPGMGVTTTLKNFLRHAWNHPFWIVACTAVADE